MKKLWLLWVAICLMTIPVFAQPGGRSSHMGGTPSGQVIGKIVDGTTNKGIGFATVGVIRAADSSVVGGVLSKENGDFTVENLPFGSYLLRINYIGFDPVYHRFSLSPKSSREDLGNFKLTPSRSTLKTVNVTATKPAYTMSLDKKVFDVSKSLTSVGGDATDVLKEVPSVSVDIDGNVTLRSGTPTIFVDGKRTTLTLDEIPAESIARIEVITNPSAKYDAEGMAGILNIVLKKNRKPGVNGMLRAGADTRGGYNAGGNLNLYRNPFNLTLSYFLHNRKGPYSGSTDRHNLFNDSWLKQTTEGDQGGRFQMGRIGLDYLMDNRNTFSFEGGIGGGSFTSNETLNSLYQNNSKTLDSSSNRQTYSDHTFRFYSGDLGYKHTFQKEGHQITADLNLRKSDNGGNGNYQTQFYDNTGKTMEGVSSQKNDRDGSDTYFVGQVDYENPLTDKAKLAAGLKATVRQSNSVYNVFDLEPDEEYVFNDYLSSDYTYDENIYAGYLQYSNEINKFGYQLGLRAEQYSYSGSIPSEHMDFKPQKDKLGLYPSVYLTYKFTDQDQVQVNYSRRVNRPNFWQRIPYTDYSDPQNLRKGNPELKPEYTNSFEISYNKFMGQSNLMATLYYRNTHNEITNYTEPFNNSTDTLISYAINAHTNNAYGAEFTLQSQLTKWWNVTANLNLFQTEISALVNSQELTNSNLSWFAKVNSDMRLPEDFSVQLSGRYSGPRVSPQGTSRNFGSVDAGLKKSFLKKKNAAVTLGVSDIFNTRRREMDYEVPGVFTQHGVRRRASRFVRINFSYSFGKQDFQLFRRKRNPSQQQSSPQEGQPEMTPDEQQSPS
jgi:outer membrane receptor protein involved in Fe transport